MKILIASATKIEIEPLLANFVERNQVNQKLREYSFKNLDIDVLVTGVGMVPTAFWLADTLSRNTYQLALNIGICGSFNNTIPLGEVLNITSDCFSEMGAEDGESFLAMADLDLLEDDDFSFNKGQIKNVFSFEHKAISSLKKASGITVNKVHGEVNSIELTKQLFCPDVESMEGAAFFYACLTHQLKNIQLRAVSNYIEKRNKENWNIPLAVNNVCNTSFQLLQHL
ncbi:MAG: futalosine hydrolase [Flavobacteriales bacterium]|nr:futalosine hydrolase [Flavobacteriales bacterium]